MLSKLKTLAELEPWDYTKPVGDAPDEPDASEESAEGPDLPILRSYLFYTFERLQEEKKVAFADLRQKRFACFNTGLVTPRQEEIFAFFTENRRRDQDPAEWFLQGFHHESDRQLLNTFPRLPDLANYFDDPSVLLYDRRRPLKLDFDHILGGDNIRRFPGDLSGNQHILRGLLEAAQTATEKRVYRNYKTAIPQFYRGEIQLLLPLCLRSRHEADVALVVSQAGEYYRGETILTLQMAYNNARLLTRPDSEWLRA